MTKLAAPAFLLLALLSFSPLAMAEGSGGPTTLNPGTTPTQQLNTGTSPTQTSGGGGTTLLNPLGTGYNLNALLVSILQFVVRIGAIVVILMLVYVGYMFVTARGEPGRISEARQALLWTIVGALVLLGSEAIAQGIQATVQALSTG